MLAGKAGGERVGMEPSDMAELLMELLLTGVDGYGQFSIFLTDPAWKFISAQEAAKSRSFGCPLTGVRGCPQPWERMRLCSGSLCHPAVPSGQ